MKPIRLLIWCPLVATGGGVRLLMKLISALAIRKDIAKIGLIVPQGSITLDQLAPLARPVVELHEFVPPPLSSPPPAPLWIRLIQRAKQIFRQDPVPPILPLGHAALLAQAPHYDLMYTSWPHRNTFPEIDIPIVCTFQDAIFFDFPEILTIRETLKEWTRAEQWLTRSAQVILSSTATREALVRHFDFPPDRGVTIHHAIVPADAPPADASPSEILKTIPERYLIFPANITTHKNHYHLLIAWARFAQRRQYPLVFTGFCTELLNQNYKKLPSIIDAARLSGVIQRHGLVAGKDFFALGYTSDEDIHHLVQRATALIMPTLAEGGGSFPVEEALCMGVPVLCSDIPVLREHLAGRTARIGWFDPESPEAIRAALSDLIEHQAEYRQSAIAGMKDPRPSWDDVAAQYAEEFTKLVWEKAHG
ncbi:MAG: glycosyltransferase family 1 protein [bacterium]